MEYLMPYTRPRPCSSTGMEVATIKRNGPENTENSSPTENIAGDIHVNSKKIQKQVLQQVKQLKCSSESESEFLPTKMSKKQLKLAQEQLKKLTKINIHLHGKFNTAIYFHKYGLRKRKRWKKIREILAKSCGVSGSNFRLEMWKT